MKLRCEVDGVPQSWKRARAEEPSNAGPSKKARSQLFISELGSEDEEVRVVAETAEVGVQAGTRSARNAGRWWRPFGPTMPPSSCK